ncbi:hypothetical protein [Crateriforma spongiae]|uniref:hypothetical protein n=1 Tax=Crateriforma spongiae TaxID=2724528 RepID=UPI0039B074EC
MLTTSQSELPLTPAVLEKLETAEGWQDVIESAVYLEIENANKERITTFRQLRGDRDKNLIGVWYGPALSQRGEYEFRDFFVNRGGGATREAGFHRELARFLGWELPLVPTFDGNESPLYLQVLFPFFFVEQKRGWSSVTPIVPSHLRIRHPHERAVEFLLSLDAYKNAVRRQELELELSRCQNDWAQTVRTAREVANQVNGACQGLQENATVKWPPAVSPSLMVPIDQQWVSITARLAQAKESLSELVEREIPRVEEIANQAESELAEAESEVSRGEAIVARLLEYARFEQAEIEAMDSRLKQIEADLIRNKDDRTLQKMGSEGFNTLNRGECPTCHQGIQDSLLPIAAGQEVMTLDQNIAFLEQQRRTIQGAIGEAQSVIDARSRQMLAIRQEISENRSKVRALRQTLISDGRLPSAAAIEERIRLEHEIERLEKVAESFQEAMSKLGTVAEEFRSLRAELQALPRENTSSDDRTKLNGWTSLMQTQLEQYGFGSFNADEIRISEDQYRPTHDGFDLPSSISASDLIRTIWAYLMGMLELARDFEISHPGLMVFDEPRQQSAREVSFRELLRRGANAKQSGQQVIFFTSEEPDHLRSALEGLDYVLHDFGDDEKIIRPDPS